MKLVRPAMMPRAIGDGRPIHQKASPDSVPTSAMETSCPANHIRGALPVTLMASKTPSC